MRPLDNALIEMMKTRGATYEPFTDAQKKVSDIFVVRSDQLTKSWHGPDENKIEIVNLGTALHFRDSGRSIFINSRTERVVVYAGTPDLSAATPPTAKVMTLDKFYEDLDTIVGAIKSHLVIAPVRPSGDRVMEAVRATT
jgi:hypothetical protein